MGAQGTGKRNYLPSTLSEKTLFWPIDFKG